MMPFAGAILKGDPIPLSGIDPDDTGCRLAPLACRTILTVGKAK
jgi:hypothetical protein